MARRRRTAFVIIDAVESGGVKLRLTDIAAQAGVSEATVSRVLNGKSGVSGSTRHAVLAALDVLGYERPARSRQRSAGLVGLITQNSTTRFPCIRANHRAHAVDARLHAGAVHADTRRH